MSRNDVIEKFNNERYATDDDMDVRMSSHYLRYKIIKSLVENIIQEKKTASLKIIDMGCGPGHLGKTLLPLGVEVWGADISDNSLVLVKEKGMKTLKVNLEEDFGISEKFDVVIATEVIEHIYDTEVFLDRLKGILKDDGVLIVTTPNVVSIGRRILMFFGTNPILDYKLSGGAGHIRYFTFKDLKSLLEEKGFEVILKKTDTVNVSFDGKIHSRILGRLFPSLGRAIVMMAKKKG